VITEKGKGSAEI